METTIREAIQQDAGALVQYLKTITAEPDLYITNWAGEFNLTDAQEAVFIQKMAEMDNSVLLVAESEGEIIGSVLLRGSERKALHHTAMLGISVAKNWRNAGVGNALMKAALAWANANGVLERIELNVYTQNLAGIHLYLKHGFVVEGHRRKAAYRDGKLHDSYIMGLLIEP